MEEIFKVKTEVFEGPLHILLELIEKRKLFINDISLAKVADDYIAYIEKTEDFPVHETANFILVASMLLLIKSRSLLPSLTLSEEEEASIEDLERRLELHKLFKELADKLAEQFGVSVIYPREENRNLEPVFSPASDLNILNLLQAMQTVIKNLPREEKMPMALVRKIISLEEMIEQLTKRIQKNLKLSFKTITNQNGEGISKEQKENIIVSFLAILELVKRGVVKANQSAFTEDIELETESLGIPSY
jgi:segregation and condensation protein A